MTDPATATPLAATSLGATYAADGFVRAVPIIGADRALGYHGQMKAVEARHRDAADADNVLFRGQRVEDVSDTEAVNVQYIAPSMRQQVSPDETALLVRGRDRYAYYAKDELASTDLAPEALAQHARLKAIRKQTWAAAAT